MALNITGRLKVKTLKRDFLKEFSLTLRVYDGRSFADDDATLASIRKGDNKGGEFAPRKNTKVGNLEDKIIQIFGIKTQVAGSDDSYLCKDDLTLAGAQEEDVKVLARRAKKAEKNANKASMVMSLETPLPGEDENEDEGFFDDGDDSDEDCFDLREKANELAEAGKAQEAKTVYQAAINKAEDVSDLTSIAGAVADNDYLGDPNWAMEIYKSALNKADECVEYNSIAEPIGDKRRMGDTELARTIYKISLNHAEDFLDFFKIANSIVGENSLRDKLWAKEVYQIALDNAEDYFYYLKILADSIADDRCLGDTNWAKEIFKSALNKADECVEYNSIAEPVGDKRRIGDTELARTIYKISLDHADDFNNFKNIADSIVGEDSLRDKLWAKEVYQIALDNAENVCDLNELADSVANDRYLGDNDWAKNIYQIAINKAENTSELCSVAGSIAAKGNFADKSWAIEIYQSAAKVAGGYDDYLSVANGLADERKANEKNLAKPYYLTALEQSQDNEERADVISNIETTLKDKNWADELKQQRLNSCKNKRNVIGISISSSITAELADWFYRGDKSDKSKGYKLACESLNEFLNGLRGKLGELGDIFEEKLLIQLDGKLEETTFNIESLSGQIDTIKVFLVITKHVPSDMLNALFFDMKEDAFEAMFSIGDDDKIVCQSYSFGRAGEGYFSADQYRRESYINNFKAGGEYGWKNYPTASKLLLR